MKLEDFLKRQYNYNPDVKDAIKSYINQWRSWYKGNVKSFHNYFIYNGNKKVKQRRYTMNMAKEISEDWSDILWSEKCEISLKNEQMQKQFNELADKLDLYSIINRALEKSGALGTSATVTGVYDILQNEDGMYLDVSNAKVRVDTVDVDWIYPLSWNNREITECAFGAVEYIQGVKYVICSVHKLDENNEYVIYNHLFRDNNGNLSEITEEQGTMKVFQTHSNIKWFSVFKPLLTNNLFNNNPFGIPHYANAIDNLKSVDIDFDALKNEIKDGRRRTFVRSDMFNYESGTQKLVFDPEEVTVYQLPNGASKDDLIQSDSDTLRTGELIDTLNTNLNILGNKVGFGENHYHFDGTNLSTATAVISSNSKLFRRKKKLEIGYYNDILNLIKSICYASSKFGTYNIDTEDMSIQFDDSIIEDKEAESVRASREVSQGLISKAEYRQKIFGESQEIAKKAIEDIQAETPGIDSLLNNNDDDDDNKDNDDNPKNNKNDKEQSDKEDDKSKKQKDNPKDDKNKKRNNVNDKK